MREISTHQINTNMKLHGITPNFIGYRTNLDTLEAAFIKLIEEKTGVKDAKIVFSADCDMDTLYTELDGVNMTEEQLDELVAHGLRENEGYENTLQLLQWMTGIKQTDFGVVAGAYLYEGESEPVEILVPTRSIYIDVEKRVREYLHFNGITLTEEQVSEITENLQKFRSADEDTFSCEMICEIRSLTETIEKPS